MIFSIKFPTVLRRTIGQKDLEVSYEDLYGFGMIINADFLK